MIVSTDMKLNTETIYTPFKKLVLSIETKREVHLKENSMKKIVSEKSMLKRAKYYIEKEVKSLKKLYSENSMDSKIEILSRDFRGRECACILFKLGTEKTGYTIYKYCVYNRNQYFYCPIFSIGEGIGYIVYLLKNYGNPRPFD